MHSDLRFQIIQRANYILIFVQVKVNNTSCESQQNRYVKRRASTRQWKLLGVARVPQVAAPLSADINRVLQFVCSKKRRSVEHAMGNWFATYV